MKHATSRAVRLIKGAFSPNLVGPEFQTFQFVLNPNSRCETSHSSDQKPQEVVSIKLNRDLVRVKCENIFQTFGTMTGSYSRLSS